MPVAASGVQRYYPPGFQPAQPKDLADAAMGLINADSQAGLTAKAGGGQTSAVQLVGGVNEISVCASSSDSVKLPPARPGTRVYLSNNGAQTAKVFSYETVNAPAIDGTAGTTGVNLATAKNAVYFCVSSAKWESILTA
jgi:hypothetical protein